MPFFYGRVTHMPIAQRRAWINAKNTNDSVLFGGPFAPPDRQVWEEMGEDLDEKEKANGPNGPVYVVARSAY